MKTTKITIIIYNKLRKKMQHLWIYFALIRTFIN